MKFYTTSNSAIPDPFDGKVTPGIRVELNNGAVIRVGEQGRGRKLMSVPVTLLYATKFPVCTDTAGKRWINLEEGQIASHRETKEMIVKEPNVEHDDRALILLSYEQGHRGTCIWEVQLSTSEWVQIPVVDDLTQQPIDIPGKLEVILRGQKAEGGAGDQSQRPEFLAIVRPGTVFRVTRTGKPRGKPEVLIFTWTGEELLVTTPKAIKDREAAQALEKKLQDDPGSFKDL